MKVVDPKKLLDWLRRQPRENEWLEFKVNEFEPTRFAHYISGLANSAMLQDEPHAYFAFGVADGPEHEVVGTILRLADEKVGNEPFCNWLERKLDPRLTLKFVPFEYDGKHHVELIIIEPAYQRPVRVDGEAYIRIDAQLRRLRDYPERERSIWLIASRFVFERGVASIHRDLTDVLGEFNIQAFLELVGRRSLTDRAKQEYLLQNEFLIDDRQGAFDVTNLCAILCANDLSRYPAIASKAPRVTVFKGKDRLEAGADVIGKRGYAVTFVRLLKFVMERVPFREEMRHGVRVKIFSYPEISIREFLANAMIHQDFTVNEGYPLVEIFDDRMQITNPGVPLIDVRRFVDSPSKTRNTRLARTMREANLCETRGSGVDRALGAIEEEALPPPLFRLAENSTVVTMYAERPFARLSKDDRIRGCYQHACLSITVAFSF